MAKRKFDLGFGLRHQHFSDWLSATHLPPLEVLVDNYLGHRGGSALYTLRRLSERTTFLFHGVGLNIGGTNPLELSYLNALKKLVVEFKPKAVSDHLCFSAGRSHVSFELLPLVQSQESARRVAERVDMAQNYLGVPLSLENVSSYVEYRQSEMSEGEFFDEVSRKSGCGLLLDVNNLYVNSYNFKFDPFVELSKYPLERVSEVHIAGHTDRGEYLFDTHDQLPCATVYELLDRALDRISDCAPVVLEWDQDDFRFDELLSVGARIQDHRSTGIVPPHVPFEARL